FKGARLSLMIFLCASPVSTLPILGESQIELDSSGQDFCGSKLVAENLPLVKRAVANNVFSLGSQKAAFVLLNFQNDANNRPWSVGDVATSLTTVNDYFYEASYHQTNLTGDVKGWYTVPFNSSTDCNTLVNSISDIPFSGPKLAGVDFNSYDRIVFLFPTISCSWAGLGQVGGQQTMSFINGNYSPKVIAHELGHGFAMGHAGYSLCSGPNPLGSECGLVEYGDPSDAMGNLHMGHFNAFHKERLGWLDGIDTPTIQLINQTVTLLLEPYEVFSKNVKALKVLKSIQSDGSQSFYYLEFRQPVGFDADLSRSRYKGNLFNGVLIHTGNSRHYDSSVLLDMTPSTPFADDSALEEGHTFSDNAAPNGGVAFTVNSISPAGANITVKFGALTTGVVPSQVNLNVDCAVIRNGNDTSIRCNTKPYRNGVDYSGGPTSAQAMYSLLVSLVALHSTY
ncbi:MAG: hypothetical protein ABIQ95_17380, partial [Bdellovibrionia bacterium]